MYMTPQKTEDQFDSTMIKSTITRIHTQITVSSFKTINENKKNIKTFSNGELLCVLFKI